MNRSGLTERIVERLGMLSASESEAGAFRYATILMSGLICLPLTSQFPSERPLMHHLIEASSPPH